jgi:hypothetical protein
LGVSARAFGHDFGATLFCLRKNFLLVSRQSSFI